ncbi:MULTISPECIES: hypothetical protein [Desulfosediminicola]|uniref:GspE/PulE/PilB domain-containing protein n=1 Tax=Desulfosediminicola TaxID=2886823 RepID=UPI0010AC440D|nr:hypothetical protein [Desulfosediminicola ganghwensis]
MAEKQRLGELLIQQKMVSKDVVDEALRLQAGGNRRLGHILVRMKAISDDQLAETLAGQLGTTICDIDQSYSPEVKKVLPRYLCRQFGVLPLSFQDNNILKVAMTDPSDQETISNLEHYTNMAVKPELARHSEIDREISKRIPFGIKDLFSPQASSIMTRSIAAVALVFALGLGFYTYDYIKKVREGTVSITNDMVLYHHHDLTLALDKEGTYSLQGHGTYAGGLYKASFNNLQDLSAFIERRAHELSGKQKEWLQWAVPQIEATRAERQK